MMREEQYEVIQLTEEKLVLRDYQKILEFAKANNMRKSVILVLQGHKNIQENFVKNFDRY